MGQVKALLIAMEEELSDMKESLNNLESELAFLEHEEYSLKERVARHREVIEDYKHEVYKQEMIINQHKGETNAMLK